MMRNFFKKHSSKIIAAGIAITLLMPASLALMPRQTHAQIALTKCIGQYFGFGATSASQESTAAAVSVPVVNYGAIFTNSLQAGYSQSTFIKDCIEHGLALALGKLLLAQMTDQIVQWINSGFQGSPQFVTDPGGFLLDVGDQIAGEFIIDSGLGALCDPFKIQLKIALLFNFNTGLNSGNYAERARCTLSEVVQNMTNFYKDFTQGGWAGWFSLTGNFNNNTYGAYLEAASALEARIGNVKITEQAKLNWGQGFFSYEECSASTATNAHSGDTRTVNGETITVKNGGTKGLQDCKIMTPGKTISGVLDSQFGIPAQQLGLADDLDKILNALANQLLQQFLAAAGGLLGGGRDSENNRRGDIDRYLGQLKSGADKASADADAGYQQVIDQNNAGAGGGLGANAGTNVAIGGTVGAFPERSVGADYNLLNDGVKTNGFSYGGETSFSGARTRGTNPWLQVKLKETTTIGRIVVYDRNGKPNTPEGDGNLVLRAVILDKDEKEVWRSTNTIPLNFSGVAKEFDDIPAIEGQTVRIIGEGTGTIQLAEIEVYPYKAPTITLKGSYVQMKTGETYTEPGFTATDKDGLDLTATVTATSVDTSKAGSYTITYTVKDKNNATGTATRQVQVLPQ